MNADHSHFSNTFRRRLYFILFVLAAIAIIGIAMRMVDAMKLKHATEEGAMVTVAVITVAQGPAEEDIVLPGNIRSWHDATLYARTNGYVKNWYYDIGAHVKAGDLLAEIATPEVNASLQQTEAQLKTAEANYALAKTTAKRWVNLLKTQSVSQQETDVQVSNEKAQAAIVESTRANRDRLQQLVDFEKIIAPFNGIITSRTIDIGQLINAGSGTTQPLFQISQADKLRVYVRVPQINAAQIKPGLTAKLFVSQHPGKIFVAKLLDTARAIDLNTRTLLIQLEIDNPNYDLLPGSYAEIHLILPTAPNVVRIPVNTLLFQKNGLQVAVLDEHHQVHLKSITVGRDFGDVVEIIAGLKPGETIILNPPDSLVSGQTVRVGDPVMARG